MNHLESHFKTVEKKLITRNNSCQDLLHQFLINGSHLSNLHQPPTEKKSNLYLKIYNVYLKVTWDGICSLFNFSRSKITVTQ